MRTRDAINGVNLKDLLVANKKFAKGPASTSNLVVVFIFTSKHLNSIPAPKLGGARSLAI